ncbi:MAG TPA: MoxR family ATPase [Pseudomonadales bacterium]|nr:MoxR family ATPase [Pseudomonadales bacterium]
MSESRAAIQRLMLDLESEIIGQHQAVQGVVIALLCGGNVLLEGLPGTAKTRLATHLAKHISASFGRVQFTPDLLPSDITGTEVLVGKGQNQQLAFEPGPIFHNIVLADEINRAPAKVQSALLEAMQEQQVTVAGKSYPLPAPFMVLATQNPIEQEGTYPLPEAQVDRFMLKLLVERPNAAQELNILRTLRQPAPPENTHVIPLDIVTQASDEIDAVTVVENVQQYIVALVMGTREPHHYPNSRLPDWIFIGASTRATLALEQAARAHAWLAGRDFVDPDDVRAMLHPVLRHRIALSYEAMAKGITSDDVITELVSQVALV